MGGLDIPCGHIVQDGVAEDVVFRLPCGNILRVLSQNDGQFTFVVQLFHEVGMGLDEAAVRHGPGDPLGKVDGVLMFGRKGVGRVFLGLVGVGHVVDAQTDDILRRRRDGAFRRDGLDGQRRDACDGQRKPGPHLRGQERDGVGQCLVRKAQPAQRPDLTAIGREDGRVFHAVGQTAGDETHRWIPPLFLIGTAAVEQNLFACSKICLCLLKQGEFCLSAAVIQFVVDKK